MRSVSVKYSPVECNATVKRKSLLVQLLLKFVKLRGYLFFLLFLAFVLYILTNMWIRDPQMRQKDNALDRLGDTKERSSNGTKGKPTVVSSKPRLRIKSKERKACEIPLDVNPFDPFVNPYMRQLTLNCPQGEEITYVDYEKGMLMVSPLVAEDVTCLFSWIRLGADDMTLSYSKIDLIPYSKGIPFSAENYFANVSCFDELQMDTPLIYRNTHLWIPDYPKTNASGPSVFILVIESLSRLSFERFMPKTNEALKRLGQFQTMRGLNKVAANSFPNSMALIAGDAMNDSVSEAIKTVWDHRLPYVWKEFKRHGYVTGFVEDLVLIGLFNYFKKGFKEPPADFWPRPFWLQMYAKGWDLYESMKNTTHFCFEKNGPKIDIFLQQMRQFMMKMKQSDQPYFMYSFYSQITHDNFNYFQYVDEPVARFVDSLRVLPELLKNTVFIIMGDHGPRFGGISDTPLGRLEGSLPMFGIRVPRQLDQKHPHLRQFLATNSDRLLTWFDIHHLLEDVAFGTFSPIERKEKSSTLSPWRESVPLGRTCSDARVPDIYCVCNGVVGADPTVGWHHYYPATQLVQSVESYLQPDCGLSLKYNKTLVVEYILSKGNQSFSTFEKVKLSVLTKPWDIVIKGIMVRTALHEEPHFGPWKVFDPTFQLNSLPHKLKLQKMLCTVDALNGTFNFPSLV